MPYNFKSEDDINGYVITEDEWVVIENWEHLPESIKQLNMRRNPGLFNCVANIKVAKAHKRNNWVPEDYTPQSKLCR